MLKLTGISKGFPGVKALDEVDFELQKNEVHAIVGENGAGKSTMMNIISGIFRPDAGNIEIEGSPVRITSPKHANSLGVATVFQELSVVQSMTVADNICFADQPTNRIGWINKKELNDRASKMLQMFNVDIQPTVKLGRLSLAMQQMIEILKALALNPKILVLDEPTSSLTVKETERLFEILNQLKSDGLSVIYISHHLDEIFRIADRVTVLRDGKKIITADTKDLTEKEIVHHMVGREIKDLDEKNTLDYSGKEPILRVQDIHAGNRVKGVTFDAYPGEVLGFSGLVGAGRTEFAHVLFGLSRSESGHIELDGKPFRPSRPVDAIKQGLIYLTEDRKQEGLFLRMSITDNISAPNLSALSFHGVFSKARSYAISEEYVNAVNVITPSIHQIVGNLSGGNQQKVLLSMWLATKPRVMVVDEPSRGVDVGAKTEIHRLIRKLAQQGNCVLVISSDLPEILTVCDRIAVMRDGQVIKVISAAEASEQMIIEAASGMLNEEN